MLPYQPWDKPIEVALLAEGVDRNFSAFSTLTSSNVALLAEGMDRNFQVYRQT